jgi:uncharacterized membrane protein
VEFYLSLGFFLLLGFGQQIVEVSILLLIQAIQLLILLVLKYSETGILDE